LTLHNTSANDSEVGPRRDSILTLRITAANACSAGMVSRTRLLSFGVSMLSEQQGAEDGKDACRAVGGGSFA
jgi:hypothetical protein